MKWSKQAEEAVSRVPFFVRKRVRNKVEEEAARRGAEVVTIEHVRSCQQRFLRNMDSEVKGYQVETCFGPGGCPNRAFVDDDLVKDLEDVLVGRNLRGFLKSKVTGALKVHHEFRVAVSDCPNACSRPQIADVGIMGAVRPRLSAEECTGCGSCLDLCQEEALQMDEVDDRPNLHPRKCVDCGGCIRVCPAAALKQDAAGYRILLGGKLGRHPRLATELDGIYSREEVLKIVGLSLDHYMAQNETGERFGEILERTGIGFLKDMQAEAGQENFSSAEKKEIL